MCPSNCCGEWRPWKCFRNLIARLYICSKIEVKLSSVVPGCSGKKQGSFHVIHLTYTFVTNLMLRSNAALDQDRLWPLWVAHHQECQTLWGWLGLEFMSPCHCDLCGCSWHITPRKGTACWLLQPVLIGFYYQIAFQGGCGKIQTHNFCWWDIYKAPNLKHKNTP